MDRKELADELERVMDGEMPKGSAFVLIGAETLKAMQDALASLEPQGDEITEAMWGGLARDIVFWMDTNTDRQPASLFKFLERIGREIPQWLRDEPGLKNLNHAISKGTRAVIIYKAMREALTPAKWREHG